jgi:hypothetical protein
VLLALALAAALAAPPSPPAGSPQEAVPIASAPPDWAPAIRKAEGAARDFQQALQARLAAALAQGGPPDAVDVCATEAPRIGAEAAAAAGVKMGRTSDRLRNPANAPPAWARTFVRLQAGEKADEVPGVAVDLGGHLGVLLPIAVKPGCLACHGAPASMSPKVREVLASRYPQDRAVDYASGDFRGYLWVEVAR